MKALAGLLIFAYVSFSVSAQQSIKYYNNNNQETTREACFSYVVGAYQPGSVDSVREYYCENDKPKLFYQVGQSGYSGRYVSFFPNGNKSLEADFASANDTLKVFYPDGTLRYQETGRKTPFEYKKLLNYRNEKGELLVENGTGFCNCSFAGLVNGSPVFRIREVGKIVDGVRDSVWVGYDDDGVKIFEERYDHGELISGTSFRHGERFEYTVIEEITTPVGGITKFYEGVAKQIKYPAKARRAGIEGRVFVEFIVEKDGSLSSIKAIKGIGGGCDEEAERAIASSIKWTIPRQRGQPVRQKMVLPINFRL